MHNRIFADLDRVVTLGGRHGLDWMVSSLSSLGLRPTGIVTTTDNGDFTGRIRHLEGGIAQDDMRNCISQLTAEPSVALAMFEYRFSGNGELSGHSLGNLILKALDHLNVRSLEAINLIRNLLKVDAFLAPMSEQPMGLIAFDHEGHGVYGEMDIDQLGNLPQELILTPPIPATRETVEVIAEADLILIGPGSFYTSLLPILLLDEIVRTLRRTPTPMVLIDDLGKEHNPAARLPLVERIVIMECYVGKWVVDAVIVGPKAGIHGINDRLVIQTPLEASDVPHCHDRVLLRSALERAIQLSG